MLGGRALDTQGRKDAYYEGRGGVLGARDLFTGASPHRSFIIPVLHDSAVHCTAAVNSTALHCTVCTDCTAERIAPRGSVLYIPCSPAHRAGSGCNCKYPSWGRDSRLVSFQSMKSDQPPRRPKCELWSKRSWSSS